MSVEVTSVLDADQWEAYGAVYAFVGNELLAPMNRSKVLTGLDPAFWQQAPAPSGDVGVRALEKLEAYARAAAEQGPEGESNPHVAGMLGASAEFAKLFIGPPAPAASPWETTNDGANAGKVGFGRATIAMQQLIAEEGLELSNENNQYADHMGIELLYLSVLCSKAARLLDDDPEAALQTAGKVAWFIKAHPLRWIGHFAENIDSARPDGYYAPLVRYVQAVLQDHIDELTRA